MPSKCALWNFIQLDFCISNLPKHMDASGDFSNRDLIPKEMNAVLEAFILRWFICVQSCVLLREVSSSCFVVISVSSPGENT